MSNWDEKLRLIEGKTQRLTEQYAQLWRLNKEQEDYIQQLEAENRRLRENLSLSGQVKPAEPIAAPSAPPQALPSDLSIEIKQYIQQLDRAIRWIEES